MIHMQNVGWAVGLAPISLNSGANTPLTIDTKGYNYVTHLIQLGLVGGAATVMTLNESETDFSGSAITAFTAAGATGNLRLPQTTDAGKIFVWHIALGGVRMRYQQLAITSGATTLWSHTAILSRANAIPITNTNRGVAAFVIG